MIIEKLLEIRFDRVKLELTKHLCWQNDSPFKIS